MYELLNDLNYNLRKLKKSLKGLELMSSPQSATKKPSFGNCARNFPKSSVKHSKEKPFLLNFVNLSTIFCPQLYATAWASQTSRCKVSCGESQPKSFDVGTDVVTCHTVVYHSYLNQGSVCSINLKFKKNILQIRSSKKDYAIHCILKGKSYGELIVLNEQFFCKV